MSENDELVRRLLEIADLADAALFDMDYRPLQALGRDAAGCIRLLEGRLAAPEKPPV